jgi:hypothetical protein
LALRLEHVLAFRNQFVEQFFNPLVRAHWPRKSPNKEFNHIRLLLRRFPPPGASAQASDTETPTEFPLLSTTSATPALAVRTSPAIIQTEALYREPAA